MRLLLIEDYKPLQDSLVKGLKEAGFAVDFTEDGKEGLWYAQSNQYDAIILDLMLPGLDGLSILKKLRQEGNNSHVLILTAKDSLEDKVKGLNLGADDYLIKPFAFEELLARLRSLIRRNYQKKSESLTASDIRIELNNKTVYKNNKAVLLTPREYALLEYLALRAGQIVTRTDIWEHVYEFNSSASSNVVDVYIGYLRKKLDKDSKSPVIHTIRGQGYLFGEKP
jgi:two-component system, OmpR family, copper resistance phosphate regulon response regulator CusR